MKIKHWTVLITSLFLWSIGFLADATEHSDIPKNPMAQNASRVNDQLDNHIKAILAADTALEFSTRWKSLVQAIPGHVIQAVKSHDNDGLAIRAVWLGIIETVDEGRSMKGGPIKREAMQYLLGFLDGRLRIQMPVWWSEKMLNSWAFSRESIVIGKGNDTLFDCFEKSIERRKDLVVRTAKTKEQGEKVMVNIGDRWIALSNDLTTKFRKSPEPLLSVSAGQKRAFIALYSSWCLPYTVTCIDWESGDYVWNAHVWAGGGLRSYTGPGYHSVEMRISNDRLVIFGVGDCAYIEGFNIKNGKNLFRFSTGY